MYELGDREGHHVYRVHSAIYILIGLSYGIAIYETQNHGACTSTTTIHTVVNNGLHCGFQEAKYVL